LCGWQKLWLRSHSFCVLNWLMAGTITRLRVQARNKRRVNVYLDGEYAFSLTALIAVPLRRGQVLSDEEIAALRHADAEQQAYDQALDFLSYRARSQAEVERYLGGKGTAPDVVAAVVSRLRDAGLLDDAAFARAWVENRQAFQPRGVRGLRYELERKGIDPEVVAQVVAGIDETESAYRAAKARARQVASLDREAFRRKLGGFLARRGFAYDVIREVVDRLWHETQKPAS
jgi:regulatory protein